MTYNVSADYITDLADVESPDITPIQAVDSSPIMSKKATVPLRLYRQLLTELEVEQTERRYLAEQHQTLQAEFDKLSTQHDALLKLMGDNQTSLEKTDSLDETDSLDVKSEIELELSTNEWVNDEPIAVETAPVILNPAPIKPSWIKVEPSTNAAVGLTEVAAPSEADSELTVGVADAPASKVERVSDVPSEQTFSDRPLELKASTAEISLEGDTPHAALNFLTALRKKERGRHVPDISQVSDTASESPLPPISLRHLSSSSTPLDMGVPAEVKIDDREAAIPVTPANTLATEATVKPKASVTADSLPIPPKPFAKFLGEESTQSTKMADRLSDSFKPLAKSTSDKSTDTSPDVEPRRPVRTVASLQPTPPIVRPALRVVPERDQSFSSRPQGLRREPEIEDLSQYETSFPKPTPTRESSASMLMGVAGACLLLCVAFGAGFLLVQPVIERIEATPPESAPQVVPEDSAE